MRSLLTVFSALSLVGAITDACLAGLLALFVAGNRMGAALDVEVFLGEALPVPLAATGIVARVFPVPEAPSVYVIAIVLYFLVRIVLAAATGAVALVAAGNAGSR